MADARVPTPATAAPAPRSRRDRAAAVERAVAVLESLLRDEAELHGALLEHLEASRDAMRTADVDALTHAGQAERGLLQRLRAAEQRRREVVTGIGAVLEPQGSDPMTLSRIAAAAGPDNGPRLLALRDELTETLAEIQRRGRILAEAAEAVGRHLAGIAQTFGAAVAGPATYGRRGRIKTSSGGSVRLNVRS
ncbi:MAG: flagellar protein FlgN [Phycisphaerales bacterium]